MKRILKIFGRLDAGGAELRTLDLIREINHRNLADVKFHILCLSGEKGILDEEFKNYGVKIHYLKLKSLEFLPRFFVLLKKEEINVIYSNVFLFSGIFMFIGWLLNVPERITHIRTLFDEKSNFIRTIRNVVLKKAITLFSTSLIGVNKAVIIENFGRSQLDIQKTEVLYNGLRVNVNEKYINKINSGGNQLNIIHIGRQVSAKNHNKLIEVFIEIAKINPNSHLYLIGKQDKLITKQLEIRLTENNLSHKVNFVGVVSDVEKYFIGKNLLIFPSKREGLPGVVLESVKNGVPVLASNLKN